MLILYVLFFGLWFYKNYKKNGFNISSFLLSLYLLSSVFSIILLYGYDEFDAERINILAILFHITCYFLFMKPFITFGNRIRIDKIPFPKYKTLQFIVYFIIVLSIASLIVSVPKMVYSFSFEDLSEARKLHNRRELFEDSNKGILEYLGSLGSALSYYSLFFCFYFLAFYRKSKILISLLLISSFGVVISNLAIMGRDGIMRWMMFFGSLYFLFNDYLNLKLKKRLKTMSMLLLIGFVIVFGAISLSRFGERDYSVFYYIMSYAGQQNIYFSYNFEKFMDGLAGGRMNFSFLFSERVSINNINDLVYADYNLNTFSSFIGSFYMDLGLIKTFFLALSLFVFNSLFLIKVNFIKLIYFLIIYEILLLGLFYYMFYSPTTVNVLLLFLFLCFIIYYHQKILLSKK